MVAQTDAEEGAVHVRVGGRVGRRQGGAEEGDVERDVEVLRLEARLLALLLRALEIACRTCLGHVMDVSWTTPMCSVEVALHEAPHPLHQLTLPEHVPDVRREQLPLLRRREAAKATAEGGRGGGQEGLLPPRERRCGSAGRELGEQHLFTGRRREEAPCGFRGRLEDSERLHHAAGRRGRGSA